jgi:probable phosphoglycerate mutase
MPSLIVVQHCQSEHHVNGLTGGWTDTGLTELGRKQARAVAETLSEFPPAERGFCTSDLLRARETAGIIGSALGMIPKNVPGLREHNNGVAAGKTRQWAKENAKACEDMPSLDRRDFEGAETQREFHARTCRCMEELILGCRDLILVTHGGALNNIVAWWLHLAVEVLPHTWPFVGSPGGITVLASDSRGRPIMRRFNDVSHLHRAGIATTAGREW